MMYFSLRMLLPCNDCPQVKAYIQEKCSREFEESMLHGMINSLTDTVVGWILQIYG